MINNTIIVGRLGQDPELRYFEAGTCKSRFSLAVDRPGGSRENKITDWFNIEAWGKLAEFSGEYLKKGMMVRSKVALKSMCGRIKQAIPVKILR